MDILDRLWSIQNDCAQYVAGSDIMRDAANEIDQLRAQLAVAQAENERLKEMAMFFSTYTDPDELEMDEIENAARESFRRANSGVRGTTITRANSYESHVIWAAKARINKELTATRTALAAAQAREEKLREGISVICGPVMCAYTERQQWEDYQELIAQPRDDSALREMIAGVYEECAKIPQSIAESLATTYGYDDMGGLSFGKGDHAEEKMGRYNELLEISDAIRALAKQKGCM